MELFGSGLKGRKRTTKANRPVFHFSTLDGVERNGGTYWYPVSIIDRLTGMNDHSRNVADYLEVPEVNFIINLKARMESNVDMRVESKATGNEAANNQSLIRVLRTPNWFQSQKEFLRNISIYRDIYGEEIWYFLTPVGMRNTYKGLFCLEPNRVEIEYSGGDYYFLESAPSVRYFYKKKNGSGRVELEKENVIHLTDNVIGGKEIMRGKSKLVALRPAIDNIRRAYHKRGIVLDMPIGSFSSDSQDATGRIPLTPDEREEAEKALMSKRGEPIVNPIPLQYVKMDLNAKSMGLFEEVQEDTMRLCDAFGVDFNLLATAKQSTFENKQKGERQTYQNTIIPNWMERQFAINHTLGTDTRSWHVVGSYDHLPVFQEDRNEKAQALNTMVAALDKALSSQAITLEQYREQLKQFGI